MQQQMLQMSQAQSQGEPASKKTGANDPDSGRFPLDFERTFSHLK